MTSTIPTEPIGSLPGPAALIKKLAELDSEARRLAPLFDQGERHGHRAIHQPRHHPGTGVGGPERAPPRRPLHRYRLAQPRKRRRSEERGLRPLTFSLIGGNSWQPMTVRCTLPEVRSAGIITFARSSTVPMRSVECFAPSSETASIVATKPSMSSMPSRGQSI